MLDFSPELNAGTGGGTLTLCDPLLPYGYSYEQLYSPKQATRQTETDYIHTDDKSTINSQKMHTNIKHSIEHHVPDRVKPSFVIFDIRAL